MSSNSKIVVHGSKDNWSEGCVSNLEFLMRIKTFNSASRGGECVPSAHSEQTARPSFREKTSNPFSVDLITFIKLSSTLPVAFGAIVAANLWPDEATKSLRRRTRHPNMADKVAFHGSLGDYLH